MSTMSSCSSLRMPARMSSVEPGLAYAESLALASGFDPAEARRIRLGIEEALNFSIKHFFDPLSDSNPRLELHFEVSSAVFHCTIIDKGLPFDMNAFPGYDKADSLDDMHMEGLGIFLIRQLMDKMTLVNRGREGKEWHLIKKNTGQHINRLMPGLDLPSVPGAEGVPGPDSPVTIRWFQPGDALEVARCAYRTYGYAYEEFVYYPEELIRLNAEAVLLSLVAVNQQGQLLGHLGIHTFKECPGLVEVRAVFVNPAFRRQGIFHRLMEHLQLEERQRGCQGDFARVVGSHLVSQKELLNDGFKSCGILLASFPDRVEFKGLTAPICSRFHAVLMYRPLAPQRIPRVYIPERHREIITAIYENLGRPFHSGGTPQSSPGTSTMMFAQREGVLNTVEIKAWGYGPDIVSEIANQWHFSRLERNDVIYLHLNLEDPSTPGIVDDCEKLGFVFAGILPDGLYEQDAIILQYLNNLEPDFESLLLVCPFSQQLLVYIQQELEREVPR